MFDGKTFAADVLDGLRAHVDKAVGPLLVRIADLEAKNAHLATLIDVFPQPISLPDVQRMVTDAVAAIPPAPAGPTGPAGKDADPVSEAQISEAVQRALEPREGFLNPVAVQVQRWLELYPPKQGEEGVPGPPGKDADPGAIDELRASLDMLQRSTLDRAEIDQLVDERIAALPAPVNGIDGEAGKDVDPEFVRSLVAEAMAEIPRPQDGKSITVDDVAPMIEEAVQRASLALPVPKDGIGLGGALIDRTGSLILTLTDGSTRELGQVVGNDGAPGAEGAPGMNGRDGFALEDFDSDVRDGGRTLVMKFEAGDTAHTVEHQLDTMIYRGVYRSDQEYLPGDTCQFGGGLWHCDKQTRAKPGEGDDWSLAVRRGRDGAGVRMDDVRPIIESGIKEVEERLTKRLDMVLANKIGR